MKKNLIYLILLSIIFYILIFFVIKNVLNKQIINGKYENKSTNNIIQNAVTNYDDIYNKIIIENSTQNISTSEITDWRLILVNYQQTINRPCTSEHNLGLAVDFNYINNEFEKTKEFSWLQKNAENYGFILRYNKNKENITQVNYEPWHWRYVGVDNAKKMNELNMCLEEYLEYLKSN